MQDALLAPTPLLVYIVCAVWLVVSVIASVLPLDALAYVPRTFVTLSSTAPHEDDGDDREVGSSAHLSSTRLTSVVSVERISPWIVSTEALYRILRFFVFWATLFATGSVIYTMAFDNTARESPNLETPAVAIIGVSAIIALVFACTAVSPESSRAGCCACTNIITIIRVPYPILIMGIITTIATLSGVDRSPDGYIRVPAETIGGTVGAWVIGAILCGVGGSTVHPLLTGFAGAISITVLYGGWEALLLLPHEDTYALPIIGTVGCWLLGAIFLRFTRASYAFVLCCVSTGVLVYLSTLLDFTHTPIPSYIAVTTLTLAIAVGIYVYRWMTFNDILLAYVVANYGDRQPSGWLGRGLFALAHSLNQGNT